MNNVKRSDIRAGLQVSIVLKQDQRSGKLTRGVVKDILTKSPSHPHGIKVRLESGAVGRVQEIMSGYAKVQCLTDPLNRVAGRVASSREMGIVRHVIGVGILAGIGFTVSLFIAELAFRNSAMAEILTDEAKIGIFLGSAIAGLIGYWVMRRVTAPRAEEATATKVATP